MATKVAGELYFDIHGQILEIFRQLRQRDGYPFDPKQLVDHLQAAIEGNFVSRNGESLKSNALSLVQPLLEAIGTVAIPARTERFVAGDRFVLNYGPKAKPGVRISYLGDQFKAWLLRKTEEPAAETMLRYSKLVKPSVDGPILAELGDKAETTLAQIWALMELQSNGEEGVLLTNGWANIFYVNGRAVDVYWHGDGWRVGAYPVSDPYEWSGESRVFSRNS